MKEKNFLIWLWLFLTITTSGCSLSKELTRDKKSANEALLLEAIDKRSFVVEVDRAHPLTGESRMLTTLYSLEVNGEKVKSHLPYFGRAYSVPYGGGDGLIFESVITDYQSSTKKKGETVLSFKAKTKEDHFVYRVYLSPSGTASIDITSIHRHPISFTGKAYPKKEE